MLGVPGYWSQKRPEIAELVPVTRARVLEVGCAEGDFLAALEGVTEAWGIEPSPASEIAGQRLHRVFQSTFEVAEAELPLGYFDVIICNDVIEHMPDHDGFLSRVGKHIAPGGVIVGSVPNVRFYNNLFQMVLEKDWHYTQAGILDRTHLRFFTEKSLKESLCRNGFTLNHFKGLRDNIDRGNAWRGFWYHWLSQFLIVATLGYFSDIQYLQFGFRASPSMPIPLVGEPAAQID
jgi:2-polyprenyl-3-methyl-5-hydroxy-6-metoxy-1,4-benzoquinol methylase